MLIVALYFMLKAGWFDAAVGALYIYIYIYIYIHT